MASSISTRTGDDGTTSLLYGQRVAKDHPQIAAVGACDELNVALGAAKLGADEPAIKALLKTVQQNLVALMAEVACAEGDVERYLKSNLARVAPADVQRLDDAVAALESRGLKFDGWATPGANASALAFDRARVTARRAERALVALPAHGRNLRPEVRQLINRLSDLLWLLARAAEA
ncbi:MAG TPA: cob(I)yrinic acid a,c-diamide adenosyltransferase [Opitutaceae bacterium]|nr:cob(I)yrinic acid a,c-diamide adenosyltransferase [Opitutaceae bacterium]